MRLSKYLMAPVQIFGQTNIWTNETVFQHESRYNNIQQTQHVTTTNNTTQHKMT